MMQEPRSSAEASGFQSLFATAAQEMSGADGAAGVTCAAQNIMESGQPESPSKKMPEGKQASGDDGGVLSALAAALAMPAAVPTQKSEPGVGEAGGAVLAIPIQASSTLDAKADAAPLPSRVTMAGHTADLPNTRNAAPPSGGFGSAAGTDCR
jgi:hypothetical protein